MTNQEKYTHVFVECFSVSPEMLNEKFTYQCVPAGNSVGHMGLSAALEDAFDIMMETDDIIDLSSYEKGKEILTSKYDLAF